MFTSNTDVFDGTKGQSRMPNFYISSNKYKKVYISVLVRRHNTISGYTILEYHRLYPFRLPSSPSYLCHKVWLWNESKLQLNCEITLSNFGDVVFIGAQISAPLLRASPTVHEIGARHKPRFLKLLWTPSWKEKENFKSNPKSELLNYYH